MDATNAGPSGPSPSGPSPWSGVDVSGVARDRAEALRLFMAATDALCAADSIGDRPDGPEAAVVAEVIAAGISRLTAAKVRLLPVVEADGRWAVGGAKSFATWVADHHHLAIHTARAQVKLGRTMRDHLPLTAAAAAAGTITAEHAQILAQLGPTTEQRRQVLADPATRVDETFLVQQAQELTVDELRVLMRQWAAYTDPDADDRGYVESCDRENLKISRLGDVYDVAGQLTIAHGQALKAALRAITPVPAAGDDRTPSQRRAQALADLATVALDQAGKGRTVRPHLSVLVPYATFEGLLTSARAARGAQGELETDGPTRSPSFATPQMLTGEAITGGPQYEDRTSISRAELDLIACDSAIARFIFGARSEILDVGRAERTFTGPRRAAIIARDKHCRYPGCTAPPIICDSHHIDQWSRDHGHTRVDRGILLCAWHHGYVHRKKIEITTRGKRFSFTDRNGREITADHHRMAPHRE